MNRIAFLSSNLSFNWQSRDKVLCLKLNLKYWNTSGMFKNFHNSLNSLEYQYSVNGLLHLHSNFQDAITPQNIA